MLLPLSDPVWARDPHSDKQINVGPLFDAFHQFDRETLQDGTSLKQAISRIIKHINLTGSKDSETMINVNFDLYRLEEMFEHIREAPPTTD